MAIDPATGRSLWETVITHRPDDLEAGRIPFSIVARPGQDILVYGQTSEPYESLALTRLLHFYRLDRDTGEIKAHWVHAVGELEYKDAVFTDNGDIILGGYVRSPYFWSDDGSREHGDSGHGVFIVRFSGEDGSYLWHRVFQNTGQDVTLAAGKDLKLGTDSHDNIFVCSDFNGQAEFDSIVLNAVENNHDNLPGEVVVASMSGASGAVRWARSFGRVSSDRCRGMVVSQYFDDQLTILYSSMGGGPSTDMMGDEFNAEFRDTHYYGLARLSREDGSLIDFVAAPLIWSSLSSSVIAQAQELAVDPITGSTAFIGAMWANDVDGASSYEFLGNDIPVVEGGTSYHLHILNPNYSVASSYQIYSSVNREDSKLEIRWMTYGQEGDLYIAGRCSCEVHIGENVICGPDEELGDNPGECRDRAFMVRLNP